jgi:cob(I)alamin adenosyltransferase
MVRTSQNRCRIHVITGDGIGKTTSSLGMALRSLGHCHRVVIIQFMKGRKDIGEYKFAKRVEGFEIFQFGRPGWVDCKSPSGADRQLARKGLDFTRFIITGDDCPRLVVLDEINLACNIGLIDVAEVLDIIRHAPRTTDIVLTGRSAPKALFDAADFVSEVRAVKVRKVRARKGIGF